MLVTGAVMNALPFAAGGDYSRTGFMGEVRRDERDREAGDGRHLPTVGLDRPNTIVIPGARVSENPEPVRLARVRTARHTGSGFAFGAPE